MVKNYAGQSLFFKIGRSIFMLRLILIIHFLSLVACLLNGLPVKYQAILILLVTASLINQLFAYNRASGACLKYLDNNGWEVTYDSHVFIPIDISAATVLTSLLTVLYFQQGEIRKILVIFKDAMTEKEYRKLRVTLKTSGLKIRNHGEI